MLASDTKRNVPGSGGRVRSTVSPLGLLSIALLGCLSAAMFGAAPLETWVDALPDEPGVAVLRQAAGIWADCMQDLALDRPYQILRQVIRNAEATRFAD